MTGRMAIAAVLVVTGCGTANWTSRDPDSHPPGGLGEAQAVCAQRVDDSLGGSVDLFSVSAAASVMNLCMADYGYARS